MCKIPKLYGNACLAAQAPVSFSALQNTFVSCRCPCLARLQQYGDSAICDEWCPDMWRIACRVKKEQHWWMFRPQPCLAILQHTDYHYLINIRWVVCWYWRLHAESRGGSTGGCSDHSLVWEPQRATDPDADCCWPRCYFHRRTHGESTGTQLLRIDLIHLHNVEL